MTTAAATAYATQHRLAMERLKRLQPALDAHQAKAAADAGNWGFGGDLVEFNAKVMEALAMVGGLTEDETTVHRI
ncbi:MAG: hypothetical protein V4706_02810 [Pseudomonadota bacterium]